MIQPARSEPAAPRAHGRSPYRVMIVDDSAVVRGLIARWLEADGEVEVVRSVADGAQAIHQIAQCSPEVVILDIAMPVMNGLDALPKILAAQPNVKVVMSSTLTRRNAEISLRALGLGAADYITKPETTRGVTTSDEFKVELTRKIKALGAAARAKSEPPASRSETAAASLPHKQAQIAAEHHFALRSPSPVVPQVIAIGSSTGGPQALMQILSGLRGELKIPILVTQHMPPTFTAILAEHLARESGLVAGEASEGEAILPGRIYVAPGGFHLVPRRDGASVRAHLNEGPSENFCRPAVDPMFRAAAGAYGPAVLAVVLTGMGHDGRDGARAIVDAGGTILVQDQQSSIVWGMPGSVAEAGLASAVLPVGELAAKILGLTKGAAL